MEQELAGLGKKERAQLAQIMRAEAATITPEQASKNLNLSRPRAAQLLARWCKKGWLSRVKHGVYVPIPLQSSTANIMADEPWVLAKSLFSPCYIGGWSAAEHWDLTEQIFNSALVFTSKKVSQREQHLNGATFTIKTIKPERLFGTTSVWLQNQKVEISNASKTIVDIFNDPATAGGIRMAADMLSLYMKQPEKNLELLLDYAKRMKNSALQKRLGFVFSILFPGEKIFISACHAAVKSGYSQLDPAVPGKELVTTWNLWVPSNWKKGTPE